MILTVNRFKIRQSVLRLALYQLSDFLGLYTDVYLPQNTNNE